MAKACSDCSNLNLKKQKYPGCFECKKQKKNVWACQDACDKFSFDNSRTSNKRKDIYHDAWVNIHKDHSKVSWGQLWALLLLFFFIWLMATISKM